jgi:hypothetical protein
MTYKFFLKEIPEPFTVWRWINDHSTMQEAIKDVSSNIDSSKLLTLNHNFNIPKIIEACNEAIDKFGYKGWQTSSRREPSYGGLSLVCNPDYKENIDANAHTLGTVKNQPTEFFYSQVGNFVSLRNTYFDSYAFRHHSPCVKETALYEFIKGFKRSPVRSRMATINSEYVSAQDRSGFGWHRDETVFENLRINIPITTDETFMFQLEKSAPEHLSIGNAYSWDTNIAHRVFPATQESKSRTHLVLGFSPWFDYLEDEDAYVSNEFYGKMHPMDMLVGGHVHSGINGLTLRS